VIEARGLRKRYGRGGRWVLDGVELAAGAGTVTAVAGGNGSGKSTLLRILAGAASPTRGRVIRPERSVGYVPERLPAQLRFTAGQYLAHLGRLRGLDRRTIDARSRELLGRLALHPGPDVPIGELSKGNSQKVALAQAFLAPARLLVLDEPYAGLDGAAAAELADLVDAARREGATVLFSTHDPARAGAADAAYRLTAGRLAAGVPVPAGPVPADPVPADPVPAAVRLTLLAVADRASPPDLARLPGVLASRYDGASRRLVVLTTDADGLLRAALATGWSFRHGQPDPPTGGPP
jgi:ABC-type multidrug transport system ATPase subunit